MAKKRDSSIIYLIVLICFFLLNLLVLNISAKIYLLPIFIVIFGTSFIFFKYRKEKFLNKYQVIIVMALIGIVQIALYYLTGFINGFSNNAVLINFERFLKIILPLVIIIIIIEFLRQMISQKYEKSALHRGLSILLFVLIDVTLFGMSTNFTLLDSTLEFLGIVLFPSIIANAVYNILVTKYGYKPIAVYRIITTISLLVIPVVPKLFMLFRAIGRIVMPFVMYLILSYMFDREKFQLVFRKKKRVSVSSIVVLIIALIISALISCQFKYGVLTIGSGSMTGSLNIGDVVLYERYDKQNLNIGDIIIFKKGNRNLVHRIVEVGIFNGDYVFVTKGDKNKLEDPGYVYRKDIQGVAKLRIRYLGFPSIWIRSIFK